MTDIKKSRLSRRSYSVSETDGEEKIREWIKAKLNVRIQNNSNLLDVLKDGSILCQMMNLIIPGSIPNIHHQAQLQEAKENIKSYNSCCQRLGIPTIEFQELYEQKNSRKENEQGTFHFPQTKNPNENILLTVNPSKLKTKHTNERRKTLPKSFGPKQNKNHQKRTSIVPNLDAQLEVKQYLQYSPELEKMARNWMEAVLKHPIGEGSLHHCLKSGIELCNLINCIVPGTILKINSSSIPYKQMENITFYLNACRKLGLISTGIFDISDLFDAKNMNNVINNIHILARYVEKLPNYSGPRMEEEDVDKTKSLFTSSLIYEGSEEFNKWLSFRAMNRKRKEVQQTFEELRKTSKVEPQPKASERYNPQKKNEISESVNSNQEKFKAEEFPAVGSVRNLSSMFSKPAEKNPNKVGKYKSSALVDEEQLELEKKAKAEKKKEKSLSQTTSNPPLKEFFSNPPTDSSLLLEKSKSNESQPSVPQSLVEHNNDEATLTQTQLKKKKEARKKIKSTIYKPRSTSVSQDKKKREEYDPIQDLPAIAPHENLQDLLQGMDTNNLLSNLDGHFPSEEEPLEFKLDSITPFSSSNCDDLLASLDQHSQENVLENLSPNSSFDIDSIDTSFLNNLEHQENTSASSSPSLSSRSFQIDGVTEDDIRQKIQGSKLDLVWEENLVPAKRKKRKENLKLQRIKLKNPTTLSQMNADDLRLLSDLPTEEEQTTIQEEETLPSFLNVFETFTEKIELVERESTLWTPYLPLIDQFCAKEDMNARKLKKVKKEIQQEDKYLVEYPFNNNNDLALLCVFDGHCGKECAEEAVKIFPKEFLQILGDPSKHRDISSVFHQAYLNVDTLLKHHEYIGTTSTTVFIWKYEGKRLLQAANVGDSCAFLLKGKEVISLTQEHKPIHQYERDRINANFASKVTEKQERVSGLAISRAFGDHFLKFNEVGIIAEPYISPPIELDTTGNILILASDGLWDVISGENALKLCSSLKTTKEMSQMLLKNALSHPRCIDNVTIITAIL